MLLIFLLVASFPCVWATYLWSIVDSATSRPTSPLAPLWSMNANSSSRTRPTQIRRSIAGRPSWLASSTSYVHTLPTLIRFDIDDGRLDPHGPHSRDAPRHQSAHLTTAAEVQRRAADARRRVRRHQLVEHRPQRHHRVLLRVPDDHRR